MRSLSSVAIFCAVATNSATLMLRPQTKFNLDIHA